MKTVVDKEIDTSVLSYKGCSLDDNSMVEFTIKGQTPDRSYEDRSVYFELVSTNTSPDGSGISMVPELNFHMWFNAEDAIELGLKLIEHGKFSMEANMIQHQQIHMDSCFQRYLSEGRIEEIEFHMVNDRPACHGGGFKTFKITPIWIEGMSPEYNEDFSFEKVIYWSSIESDYHDQLDYYTKGVSYSFVDYDHDEEVAEFERQMAEYSSMQPMDDTLGVQPVEQE